MIMDAISSSIRTPTHKTAAAMEGKAKWNDGDKIPSLRTVESTIGRAERS